MAGATPTCGGYVQATLPRSRASVALHLQLQLQLRRKEARRTVWVGRGSGYSSAARQGPQEATGVTKEEQSWVNCPDHGLSKNSNMARWSPPKKEQAWLPPGAPSAAAPDFYRNSLPHTSFLFTHHGQWPGVLAREPVSKMGGLQPDRCMLPRSCLSSLHAEAVTSGSRV